MGNLLAFNESIFGEDFGVRPFRIRHRLAGHPFLSLDRILDVVPRLRSDRVEYHAGTVAGRTGEGSLPHLGESASWMVLKNVECDPELGWLVDAALDDVAAHSERIDPGMRAREGFVFVSAPEVVTPYHADPEHTFLLQVRGTKTVHLFDGRDRAVLSEEELEALYAAGERNLEFREPLQARARTFVLQPGDGLYFPVTHPHWVKNGPEPSISFSATFRTSGTDARERLYKMNAKLRAFGLSSPAPGTVPAIDRAKLMAFDVGRAAKRFFAHEPAFDAV